MEMFASWLLCLHDLLCEKKCCVSASCRYVLCDQISLFPLRQQFTEHLLTVSRDLSAIVKVSDKGKFPFAPVSQSVNRNVVVGLFKGRENADQYNTGFLCQEQLKLDPSDVSGLRNVSLGPSQEELAEFQQSCFRCRGRSVGFGVPRRHGCYTNKRQSCTGTILGL